MRTLYLSPRFAHLGPALYRDQGLLEQCGLGFGRVKSTDRMLVPDETDLLLDYDDAGLWGEAVPGASGMVGPRGDGHFGRVIAWLADDMPCLLSRWEELQGPSTGATLYGSVLESERDTPALEWVLARLRRSHAFSQGREVDWARLEDETGERLARAEDAIGRRRAWERLFASLHDSHTRLVSLGRPDECPRVHCGVYGRREDGAFYIHHVVAGSAGEEAGLATGDTVCTINGARLGRFLQQESAYWSFSSSHLRQACLRFLPWYQPAGTVLELVTTAGARTLRFPGESYPGFLHWAYVGRPDPISIKELRRDHWGLRVRYFEGGEGFVQQCEQALRAVPPGATLELDLRGNLGGNGAGALALAGMLLLPRTPFSSRRLWRAGGPWTPWVTGDTEGEQLYAGELEVQMDACCASATEGLIGALKSAGRAACRGERTAGASGNPRTFAGPDGVRFTCSSCEERTPAGEYLEGRGVEPSR